MKKLAVCLLCLTSALASAGPEPVAPSSLTVDFGAAAIAGAGRLIKVMNVPVVKGSTLSYYNADLEFQFLADGRLAAVLTNASVTSGPASSQSSSNFNFLPGTYKSVASGCLWALSAASIGPDGARSSSFYKTDINCVGAGSTSFAWSTAPGPTNPFVSSSARNQFPSDAAFGIGSSGSTIRAIASGTAISIAGYDETTNGYAGGLFGTSVSTFIKQ